MKKSFTSRLLLCLALTSAFYTISAQTCGRANFNFKPIYDSVDSNRQVRLYDRFGNEFNRLLAHIKKPDSTQPPIPLESLSANYPNVLNSIPVLEYCDAGIFRIYYAVDNPGFGLDIAANRQTICQVFKDISVLIRHNNPPLEKKVKILICSDVSHANIFLNAMGTNRLTIGSSMFLIHENLKNSILEGEIAKTIKSGDNSYKNLPFSSYQNTMWTMGNHYLHGYLSINFTNFTWNNSITNTTISSTQYDLYSNVLHEVMHMLGVTSFIGQNGSSRVNDGIYSSYDKLMKKGTTNMIGYNATTYQWDYTGGLGNQANGCGNTATNTINFTGLNLSTHGLYTDTPFREDVSLNHTSCTGGNCASYAAPSNNFVTTHCRDAGSGFIKRRSNANEVKMLCDLGFVLENLPISPRYGDNPSNTTIFNTYSNCSAYPVLVVGKNDLYFTHPSTPITIPISGIISNDINTSKVKPNHIHLLTNGSGTVVVNTTAGVPTSITYTPSASFSGHAMISYIPMNSSNVEGSPTYITIYVPFDFPYACEENNKCNLICNGDFENTSIGNFNYHWGIKRGKFTTNGFGLYTNSNATSSHVNTSNCLFGHCNCYTGVETNSIMSVTNVAANGGSRFAVLRTSYEAFYKNPPAVFSDINEPIESIMYFNTIPNQLRF